MARKKSVIARIFLGIGKAMGWFIVSLFRAVWFLIVGLFTVISHAVSAGKGVAKSAHQSYKIRKDQPKVEASYVPLDVASTKSGAVESFAKRLLNESLILAIAGRRGSGKSVLGFRLMENIHAKSKRPCFALGVRQDVLPSWIESIESLDTIKNGGVVLVDEGAVSFNSRDSMSKKNKGLGELLAIARHKDLTLIFITQNTGMIDKNVLNLCDTILVKEGSLLQEKMERSVMKDLYVKANESLQKIPSEHRKAHCYVFDAEFEGVISTKLPGFWSSRVSKNQA